MSSAVSSTASHVQSNVDFLNDVIEGLSATQKTLPCKYFYDARGSELFDQICELEEYYPTRTELSIMESSVGQMAEVIGSDCTLIEFGSGSSLKTRLLLDHLSPPLTYAPVDISGDYLFEVADSLRDRYCNFDIVPIVADFTQPLNATDLVDAPARRMIYFPGSTIGNFIITEARQLLQQMATLAGEGGSVLIGIDLEKNIEILEQAYDDERGVTAEFNQNLLLRINNELDGNFDLGQFRHEAVWNSDHSRIEMHLVSEREQSVSIADREIKFARHETIHTENSHKYTHERFEEMAATAGMEVQQKWTDEREWFAIFHCTVK